MTVADTLSDAELVGAVRQGAIGAYQVLYERHSEAALRLARQLTWCRTSADDLVSDAFATILESLRKGRGPDTAFRTYLLTTVRNSAYQRYRKERRVSLVDDVQELPCTAAEDGPAARVLASAERTMVAEAFGRLPERWRMVLWHTEVERRSAAQIAPLLGLSPNNVAVLAYRAREGLRQEYLQAHLAGVEDKLCRVVLTRLGGWTRGRLPKCAKVQVETHLDHCDRCRALAAELAEINRSMRAVVAPAVLGGAAVGYLAGTDDVTQAAPMLGRANRRWLATKEMAIGASTTFLAVAAIALTGAGEPSIPVAHAEVAASSTGHGPVLENNTDVVRPAEPPKPSFQPAPVTTARSSTAPTPETAPPTRTIAPPTGKTAPSSQNTPPPSREPAAPQQSPPSRGSAPSTPPPATSDVPRDPTLRVIVDSPLGTVEVGARLSGPTPPGG